MLARSILLAAFCLLTAPAWAQQQRLNVAPAESSVHFELGDVLHAVHGTFKVEQGTVRFSREEGPMSGTVTVDPASGDSGNGSRDKKMTNDELKAPTYTTVTFAPKHHTGVIHPTGDSAIVVEGTFTLLGAAHEISVPMQVHIEGTGCKATGSFTVPYVQWGLKDPSTFILRVGKDVKINLDLSGSLTEGTSTEGGHS